MGVVTIKQIVHCTLNIATHTFVKSLRLIAKPKQLMGVMKKHNLINKKNNDKYNDKEKYNDKDNGKYIKRTP